MAVPFAATDTVKLLPSSEVTVCSTPSPLLTVSFSPGLTVAGVLNVKLEIVIWAPAEADGADEVVDVLVDEAAGEVALLLWLPHAARIRPAVATAATRTKGVMSLRTLRTPSGFNRAQFIGRRLDTVKWTWNDCRPDTMRGG